MIGAIAGDIIGSRYEFDMGNKSKEFPLFDDGCYLTDDTVMTVAVAEALLRCGKDTDETGFKKTLIRLMKEWGRRYPDAGYGGRFGVWLLSDDDSAYGSYGNGSAMRVAPVGWFFDTLERTREVARWSSEVTHDHPEGIKGAESVASVIFLARTGHDRSFIRDYVIREFGYDLSRTCDDIRPSYHHVESCQETVPEAITAFLEGADFEDVVRNAVSLGGDCDTLTDIAAAMGEAFFGIPKVPFGDELLKRIPDSMREILETEPFRANCPWIS